MFDGRQPRSAIGSSTIVPSAFLVILAFHVVVVGASIALTVRRLAGTRRAVSHVQV
jgi:hypothetical protein